ncbi:hypothetical protein O181_020462 [Austropuccinia psidii MF-1]|uniref:Protein kinase domain-containing protein n=1 Tax=Austropuccinia psidii MF-1 TaxID=1389203 RepID=A0A9Q3GVC3_9BASI|nr:hypothetical protein [Austropuccinia psidii MF-1]
MNRHRFQPQSNSTGEKAQLVLAYQELGKELHSTQLKVVGNYTLGRIIGEGSFGTVRLGIHRLTGSRVAIKQIPKSSSPPLLTREIHHHRRLHHPNVVQLFEVIATEHTIWLITELCPGGELFDYLVEKTKFSEFEARRLFGQICLGLGYVHRQGVIHRDLKLENVLLDERCNPKLADFGFGREFEPRKLLDTFCGTTGYAAPEMLAGKKYFGQEVDIWSLGIILHALLTGSLPFDDDDEEVMKSMILAGHFEIPNFLSLEAANLIKAILKLDPTSRLSIEQILSHPWFTTQPSLHTFPNEESLSRPSPITEESALLPDHNLIQSNRSHQPIQSSDPSQPSSSLKTNPLNSSLAESDPSESSFKDSDLDVASRRSHSSSPVTSEDNPSSQFNSISNLGHSSFNSLSTGSQNSPSRTKSSSLLQHRNNSNSTIKKLLNPSPHPTHINNLHPLHLHPQTKNTPVNSNLIKNNDNDDNNLSQINKIKIEPPKPRPLSILPALPSAVAHPQIRTPSRTKRRSIGSTMSERIAPIDDPHQASDLTSPPSNQARLSVSSLSAIVINYVGALKATTQTQLLSDEDLELLRSLATLGFDTGQIIHSVQSNACDSSGAMWWLMKRKLEKQKVDRENADRNLSLSLANSNVVHQPTSQFQAIASLTESPVTATRFDFDATASSSSLQDSSVVLPLSSSQNSIIDKSKQSTPKKSKPLITSSPKNESPSHLSKADKADKESLLIDHHRSTISAFTSRKINILTSTNFHDDAKSSSSSLKADTLSLEKDNGLPLNPDPSLSKKLNSEQRKRSQSVSMLQRATHALVTKKSADEKSPKSRFREPSYSGCEGDEKISKKDLKARERDHKMIPEDGVKSSSSMQLSVLFSRRALIVPPIPHLPAGLIPQAFGIQQDKLFVEKNDQKSKELPVSTANDKPSASIPSSPSRFAQPNSSPKRDNEHAQSGVGSSDNVVSLLTSSLSLSTIRPNETYMNQTDVFGTPKQKSLSTRSPSQFEEKTSPESKSAFSPSVPVEVTTSSQGVDDRPPVKDRRPKGNLFSSFRLWFNEDRRKRKRNMVALANYPNGINSPTIRPSIRNAGQPSNSGCASSPGASYLAGGLQDRKLHGIDSQTLRAGVGSGSVHRQTSKSSGRSSLRSTRRVSGEIYTHPKVKRRSGSSRASFGSMTENRTSSSFCDDSSRLMPSGMHKRQPSTSSTGSRRSTSGFNHLATSATSVPHPGYICRKSSTGTTIVRRITTSSTGSGGGLSSNRPKQSRVASGTSSVRTSMSSSEEGSMSINRIVSVGANDHKLHSPINGYEVDETIEEEDDDGEENETGEIIDNSRVDYANQTDLARQNAFQKLSGSNSQESKGQGRLTVGDGDSLSQNGPSVATPRTIFMAHKPHSVFGTPTQAFFSRSTAYSPVATRFGQGSGGNGSGSSYANLMKSIADGPRSRRHNGPTVFRDVFASKVTEDGDWVDMDDEDDVGHRYEGGIGQGVKRRAQGGIMDTTEARRQTDKPMDSSALKEEYDSKHRLRLHPKPLGNSPAPLSIGSSVINGSNMSNATSDHTGNWRGRNPKIVSHLKSTAIAEEDEEE